MPLCLVLAVILVTGASRSAAQAPQLAEADRVRIAEALRLNDQLGDRIWPGLSATPMPVLLVTDSAEFLVGHDRPGPDFVPAGRDPLLGRVSTRARRLSPTLLATFPIAGVPTIVIGTAERTGKSSTSWVLTLLHEHFHQWQYSMPGYYPGVARLDLAGGDTSGMWMLNYRFPYDSSPVARAMSRWALALRRWLDSRDKHSELLRHVVSARDELRRVLSPADYRYLEFQLWQEGVARFIEYRTAKLASRQGSPTSNFRSLPDYLPYRAAADKAREALLEELERIDLEKNRRVSFYPIGAAIAMLLEENYPEWKRAYSDGPLSLAELLSQFRR